MPIIIAVAGSSGAGKTSVAKELAHHFNQDNPAQCVILSADNYYKDQSHLSRTARETLNYDHPDTIDFALLKQHLKALKKDESIELPNYDFETHCRTEKTTLIDSANIIIIEGILLLVPETGLADAFDAKLFVTSDPSLCFNRRLKRDITERGRTQSSVKEQYAATVGPMDTQFVRPSRRHADLAIKNSAHNIKSTHDLLFNLNPVIRYLQPILNGEPPPSNQTLWNWFQKTPTEITLTPHGHSEADESPDDFFKSTCILS